ncbi:hypothetical protein ACFVFQ_36945 [Streptomyces sp. NPDC057743]|uniref:hypothetical protein n=1 Tax=Streptomyces sp. NPDC057743 TaxID=3346236 RepID=UPI0036A43FBF
MSFGDQNIPYGQPPAAPYPQQVPPPGQPYAPYPQQAGYPGGPAVPTAMPGLTKAARIMMYVIASLHLLITLAFGVAVTQIDKAVGQAGVGGTITTANGQDVDVSTVANVGKGVIGFFILLALVFAVIGFVLAARYGKGGNGVRIGSIVYASFGIVSGFFNITTWGLGLVVLVLSILVIVFCAKRASADWFQRPRS